MMPAKELAPDAPGCWQAKPTSTPTLPNHPGVVLVRLSTTSTKLSAPSGLVRQVRKPVEEAVQGVEEVAGQREARKAAPQQDHGTDLKTETPQKQVAVPRQLRYSWGWGKLLPFGRANFPCPLRTWYQYYPHLRSLEKPQCAKFQAEVDGPLRKISSRGRRTRAQILKMTQPHLFVSG